MRHTFGKVNPSAKLAETFPYKLEDNPSFLTGFGDGDAVSYSEGLFVGYRYYDKKKCLYSFRLDMVYRILHSNIQTLYYQAQR